MTIIDMMTKKQYDRREFHAYSQQGYLSKYYIFHSETNFTYKCNVNPVQPTKINYIVQIVIFLVAAKSVSSRKWSK